MVNAIMYQTLNVAPPPPSSLNPQVPEMLDYILAKALDKILENRYQTALELAEDLRTCRETLLRTLDNHAGLPSRVRDETLLANTAKPSHKESSAGANDSMAATLKLSSAFDSTAATMRLAALTAEAVDLQAISETLEHERIPTAHAAMRQPRFETRKSHKGRRRLGSWILIFLLLLIAGGVVLVWF
jgi:serine/threonine-protein kinase